MTKKTNSKPLGLINRRPVGAISQTNQSDILKDDNHLNTSTKKHHKKRDANALKHTMKIPQDVYRKLQVVKKINNNKYDYSTIDFLIDDYINNAADDDVRFFKMLYNKMDK